MTPPAPPPVEDVKEQASSATTVRLTADEHFENVPSRSGVTVPTLSIVPASPWAGVLLFPGGDGWLQLSETSIGRGADNFVVRIRQQFAAAGIAAVVVDLPSDVAMPASGHYRESPEEVDDVRAVLAWERAKAPVPFWLVGTSRGTISAANAASHGSGAAGLVLTASITAGKREKLPDLPLDRIAIPTLLVHHNADECPASPPNHLGRLKRELAGSPRVVAFRIDGGLPGESRNCGPLSPHGFYGLEAQVVAAIVQFMRDGNLR